MLTMSRRTRVALCQETIKDCLIHKRRLHLRTTLRLYTKEYLYSSFFRGTSKSYYPAKTYVKVRSFRVILGIWWSSFSLFH